jgi:hypothetical protein
MKTNSLLGLLVASLLSGGFAQATLIDRGGGMIYDADRDITWLADAGYSKTQYIASGGTSGDADGYMNWHDANAWADGLVYGGYDDWRLPSTPQPDPTCSAQQVISGGSLSAGRNCTGSELGHLFYLELDGVSGSSILTSTDADLSLFRNIEARYLYWTAAGFNNKLAWAFGMNLGGQALYDKTMAYSAWAVRDGDVRAIPEPKTLQLILAACFGLAVSRRALRARV